MHRHAVFVHDLCLIRACGDLLACAVHEEVAALRCRKGFLRGTAGRCQTWRQPFDMPRDRTSRWNLKAETPLASPKLGRCVPSFLVPHLEPSPDGSHPKPAVLSSPRPRFGYLKS